jgi:hypothetical protein
MYLKGLASGEDGRTHMFHSGPPEIGPGEVEKLGVLGDGSFGTVYRYVSADVLILLMNLFFSNCLFVLQGSLSFAGGSNQGAASTRS